MSSLSQQLQEISAKNASVALDRKSRTTVHSQSLIFELKVAAAQDFEYIYQIACEGLEELVAIDGRFAKFELTLFAPASVSFDLNVLLKDVVSQAEKNADAFINMAGPLFSLSPALKALEWLVRRFHVNVRMPEQLLLAALPYHSKPVFSRFMRVIPKSSWPAIFVPILRYRETLGMPPALSILKCFHSDAAFFKLYSQYLADALRNRTAYKAQLVFYLANTAQVLASHARDTPRLNEQYIPVILETAVEFFRDRSFKFSPTLATDVRLTIYAILSVLCSLVPLLQELIFSLTRSVLQSNAAFTPSLRRQTLVLLGQMWHFYNELDVPSSLVVFADLPVNMLLEHEQLLHILADEKHHLCKFLFFFLADKINHEDGDAAKIVALINPGDSEFVFEALAAKLLLVLDRPFGTKMKSRAAASFERMVRADRPKLEAILQRHSKTLGDLEMALSRTLSDQDASEGDADTDYMLPPVEIRDNGDTKVKFSDIDCMQDSFIWLVSSPEFARLVLVLLDGMPRAGSAVEQVNTAVLFVKMVVQSGPESQCSFLLRVSLTPAVLLNVRLASLKGVLVTIEEASKNDEKHAFYLLVPFLLLVFADTNKTIRGYALQLLEQVRDLTSALVAREGKKAKCKLFMERQIYGEIAPLKRSIITPQDAQFMLELFFENKDLFSSALLDASRTGNLVFDGLFKASKPGQKKFGSVLVRTFVLNQWSLSGLALVFKWRAWAVVSAQNLAQNGMDDRLVFADDLRSFFSEKNPWKSEAVAARIPLEDVVKVAVDMAGGRASSDEEEEKKEVTWLVRALSCCSSKEEEKEGDRYLQIAANKRLVALFPTLYSTELKLHICSEMVELLVADSNTYLAFDPLETLQTLVFTMESMVALLNTVNIVTQVPEQGVAKRRRRSSASTQKNMALDDISTVAARHLRKVSVILDVLESHLRRDPVPLAGPDLLRELFKLLTDLDYIFSDGKMPVLYAQETLASCMYLAVVAMKLQEQQPKVDSNSIRADLIVSSIRLSQSPQVQNRLLLVVAELAALAPETVLHSVMPIFTFMGAHTVRQDDEFSSSALQQTIAKVVPAIARASPSSSADSEVEFLLASFITAFPHIPRHRRVRLFAQLVQTVGCVQALPTIFFLAAQQYSGNLQRHKMQECDALSDFAAALLRAVPADTCVRGIHGFFELWGALPSRALEKDSDSFLQLSARPVYGASVVSLSSKELCVLRCRLVQFLNRTLALDEKELAISSGSSVVSLKMKVALTLFDTSTPESEKDALLRRSSDLISYILTTLESLVSLQDTMNNNPEIAEELYGLLRAVMNLLPLSHYVQSILEPLQNVSDDASAQVAKNFALLAGQRVDAEVARASWDTHVDTAIAEKLLPVLVAGVKNFHRVELVQAYLDTVATIVTKLAATAPDFARSAHAKLLVTSLHVLTSKQGLLSAHPEVVVSSLSAITSIVNCLGVKCIGHFPQILPPALAIWEATRPAPKHHVSDSEDDNDALSDEERAENPETAGNSEVSPEEERNAVVQGSVLMLFVCLFKRMPAFVLSSLIPMIRAVLLSDSVDSPIRAGVLALMVEHVDQAQVLQAMCSMAISENVYELDSAVNLGLYLNGMRLAIEHCDKKAATSTAQLYMKWMIKSFEFRSVIGGAKFNDNTVCRIEASFHECALKFVMKLNDRNFRPLFASLVRWAITGEGCGGGLISGGCQESNSRHVVTESPTETRMTGFFRFFNKLQDSLRGIVTSYFSYLLDATVQLLVDLQTGKVANTNLRRFVLHSLASSFKYDQDDYWSHQSRFDSVMLPLLGQLSNIEDSIGKHLVKAIAFFVATVSSEEHNEKLVYALIKYVSNDHENSLQTKIWTIRTMKAVLQKMGEQWLSYLPVFIPYIAELLEDDDEEVEMEVRKDLVRVIESILGEPLDRYLS